ncbi:AMP-binding protein [Bradyrhizobium tropiciagri]|uniref:class I adenylate-forming enzyme family protein n=1 Tax=Bradyrhizobium tropiciagri TaxID=312253 RepID=UPI001BAB20DE|nr:AMP-binding protein [Bradyrhizobium tropiciagri]MBR0874562.1 AMP-binding protein [Bradyrhizobium tropiciagri]
MITQALHRRAATSPHREFVVTDEVTISYGQMSLLVRRFASRLAGSGVRRGQSVALICGNRPAFLIAWFALNDLGAITVPLNTGLVGEGLRYTLTQSNSSLLLIEPDLLATMAADLEQLPSKLPTMLLDQSVETDGADGDAVEIVAGGDTEPNSILYTSGTTGLPKGAVLPHGSYLQAGKDMARSLGLTEDDRIMVFLPLFHANPQMYAVLPALEVGAALILRPRFSAGDFFTDARRHRATGFTYVGTVLSILIKRHEEEQRDHGLRWCVGGGAPLNIWRSVEQRFNIAVRELYGMTETGGWVTMNTAEASRLGSVGRPRQGIEVAIRNDGGDARQGTSGEIVARAADPTVFLSEYWNNPEATGATLRDGWLHTGDRGSIDADGFLFFEGRLKDLIRRAGEMISPAEIETQLLKHPEVRECAVVGVPDELLGEQVVAVVVAARPLAADVLREFMRARIAAHLLPGSFVFADALPKTETEKIKRHEVIKLAATIST